MRMFCVWQTYGKRMPVEGAVVALTNWRESGGCGRWRVGLKPDLRVLSAAGGEVALAGEPG